MSLDPVALVVLGWAGGNISAGAGRYLQDRVFQRLEKTFGQASQKKGSPIDSSDRVKAKAFAEAAFTDDEVTLEYLAGVLAASGPDDDSGAAIVAQIGRLSAFHLRLHYLVYRELRRLWVGPLNLYDEQAAHKAGIALPLSELAKVLRVNGPRSPADAVPALVRENLLSMGYRFGRTDLADPGSYRLDVRPTGHGAELFLWGTGSSGPPTPYLTAPSTSTS